MTPTLSRYLEAGLSAETRRLTRASAGTLASQLARLAVLAEHDLDAAIDGLVRIGASLSASGGLKAHAGRSGRGAVALAEAQAETMVAVVEAAFHDAGLAREQEDRVRSFLVVRLREAAELQDGEARS